jgi:hypothetical protein
LRCREPETAAVRSAQQSQRPSIAVGTSVGTTALADPRWMMAESFDTGLQRSPFAAHHASDLLKPQQMKYDSPSF